MGFGQSVRRFQGFGIEGSGAEREKGASSSAAAAVLRRPQRKTDVDAGNGSGHERNLAGITAFCVLVV